MTRKRLGLVGGLIAALMLAGCGGASDSATEVKRVRVSAAASLAEVFADMELAFEEANPGLDVVLNLGGSSSLREQIIEGAPIDVFAPANVANMDLVVAAGRVIGETRIFAKNQLEIAVPFGNPAGVQGLADFASDELLIGMCAAAVPCGDFGRRVLGNAAVVARVDTYEPDVRALLTKVEAGELDAGLVYATDIAAAGGRAEGIGIPAADNVLANYPLAVVDGGSNPAGGAAFAEFVLSATGREILSRHGFLEP